MTKHSRAPLFLAAALGVAAVVTGNQADAGSDLAREPDIRGPLAFAADRAELLAQAGDSAPVSFDLATRTVQVGRVELGPAGLEAFRRGVIEGALLEPELAEKVHGPDDRIRVTDTTGEPWRTVCKVNITMPNGGQYMGSAIMVGPRHALTAGHNVYGSSGGGYAQSLTIIPGYENGSAPLGSAAVTKVYTFSGWTQNEDPGWDMALVELSQPLGDQTGWLEMAAVSTSSLGAASLNTAGYPGDLYNGEFMYYAHGPTLNLDDKMIYYTGTMDTAGGQSGSGVWGKTSDGTRLVVGVHTYGMTDYNAATRLTETKLGYIADWMNNASPPPQSGAALSVGTVTSTLQGNVRPNATGVLKAAIRNDGGTDVTVPVEAIAYDHAGQRGWVLSAREVQFDAQGAVDVEIGFSIPDSPQDIPLNLYVWVNREELVQEDDYEDNIGAGPEITITEQGGSSPPTTLTATRGRNRFILMDDQVQRYRFSVGSRAKRLKVIFNGSRSASAIVTSPSGETFSMGRKFKQRRPEPGTWTVEFQNDPGTVGNRNYWFKVKAR